jgi:hypothetical protein
MRGAAALVVSSGGTDRSVMGASQGRSSARRHLTVLA